MKYLICNIGCDDTTETEIELTEEELKTIIRFAKENNENSTYQCKPSIAIYGKYLINKTGNDEDDYFWYEYNDEDNLV